jgi:hypothetical protein
MRLATMTISQIMHDMIFRDTSQSLCARAFDLRDSSTFWLVWYHVFGPKHCERSFRYHRGNKP